MPGGLASGVGRRGHPHPVRPRGGRADGPAARPAGHRGRALAPGARGRSHHVRAGRGLRRAAGDDALRAAAGLWRGGGVPVSGARRAGAAPARALRRGDRPRPAQGVFEDGHLDHPELPGCADLRGSRAGVGADRPLLPGHGVACRRDRPGRAALGGRGPPRRRIRGRAGGARPGRRVPAAAARRAPPVGRKGGRIAAAGGARPQSRPVRGVRRRGRPAGRRHHPARAAGASGGGRAAGARPGGAVHRHPAPVRHRRHEPGFDLARGARDAGHRHEPAGRPLQHRRGRRGRGPFAAGPKRRPAPVGHQAGGVRPFRRDRRIPGGRRSAADQDRPGSQARRGRTAARAQGGRGHRPAPPLHPGRGPDLARRRTTTSTRSRTWPS